MPTHKKAHDKDKYYHLAKDQGYRSRAAFKLIQINKRYSFLGHAKVCIDLCAAPGGWCQVAAKLMPVGSLILGVDLLPIKAIRNVKTIVEDITTAECRRHIVQELQGWKADVVLCDGAPNIGSSYSKDAFVQNELVLAALKTATDHLVRGGTFCTKVYRSTDYNSIIWVLQQLFEDVQTMKPNSSRSQSSETFIICLRYTAPDKVDPKLLDPNHVFKEVADPGEEKINVLHKKFEQHNKRHRTGYDESLGVTLRSAATVSEFIDSTEPIKMLTYATEMVFSDSEMCQAIKQHPKTTQELVQCFADLKVLGKTDFKKMLRWRLQVRNSLELETAAPLDAQNADDASSSQKGVKDWRDASELTEEEIQEEILKQRVQLLLEQRRTKKKDRMQSAKERRRLELGMSGDGFGVDDDIDLFRLEKDITEDDMADINLDEIDEFPHVTNQYGKLNDEVDDDDLIEDVPHGKRRRSAIIELTDNDMEEELEQDYKRFLTGRRARLAVEQDLQAAASASGDLNETVTAKRLRLSQQPDAQLAELAATDEMLLQSTQDMDDDEEAREIIAAATSLNKRKKRKDALGSMHGQSELDAYVTMLERKKTKKPAADSKEGSSRVDDSDSSDSSDSDNDSNDNNDSVDVSDAEEAMKTAVVAPASKAKSNGTKETKSDAKKAAVGRKMVSFSEEGVSVKAAQWFSNPIFTTTLVKGDEEPSSAPAAATETAAVAASKKRKQRPGASSSADSDDDAAFNEMLSMMPKTDKEKRKEQRKKDAERKQRREVKQNKILLEDDEEPNLAVGPNGDIIKIGGGAKISDNASAAAVGQSFEIVPAALDDDDALASSAIRKMLKRKHGADAGSDSDGSSENETAAAAVARLSSKARKAATALAALPQRVDDRMYDSDNEDYDVHDRTRTLALGTMMLRHSKRKALIDASYNRFAWNDPSSLPSWFIDDELRHNKPQVPIPGALMDQIKSRFQKTGTKEIKKVAEARARKHKRAVLKLKAAKKAASNLAENSEMSEKQKLRAITKALKTKKVDKPEKMYVVTKKTKAGSSGTSSGGKGKMKFVDKRLKCDARAMKRREKASKGGSKRKRH